MSDTTVTTRNGRWGTYSWTTGFQEAPQASSDERNPLNEDAVLDRASELEREGCVVEANALLEKACELA